MKHLIIYAHPGGEGHCSAILEQIKTNITDYEVLDLYKMKFDPVLTQEEIINQKPTKKNKNIQLTINKTKKLIFIYPGWWGGMPAILKGFFDRVFTVGFAFERTGSFPTPLLKGKQAIVFITTGGSRLLYLLMGNRYVNSIKDIMRLVGIKTKVFHIGRCKKLTREKRIQIKNIVKKALIKFS